MRPRRDDTGMPGVHIVDGPTVLEILAGYDTSPMERERERSIDPCAWACVMQTNDLGVRIEGLLHQWLKCNKVKDGP